MLLNQIKRITSVPSKNSGVTRHIPSFSSKVMGIMSAPRGVQCQNVSACVTGDRNMGSQDLSSIT